MRVQDIAMAGTNEMRQRKRIAHDDERVPACSVQPDELASRHFDVGLETPPAGDDDWAMAGGREHADEIDSALVGRAGIERWHGNENRQQFLCWRRHEQWVVLLALSVLSRVRRGGILSDG